MKTLYLLAFIGGAMTTIILFNIIRGPFDAFTFSTAVFTLITSTIGYLMEKRDYLKRSNQHDR